MDDHLVSGSSGQMTTRGVKRLASASISSPANQGVIHSSESKKRRRHILLQESMRRATKKRAEANQKLLSESFHCQHDLSYIYIYIYYGKRPTGNQRKAPAIHETHNQYNKLPKLSPMDLSRMKAEKDARDSQDLAMARQRQNILLREQAQHVATIPVRDLLSIGSILITSFPDCPGAITIATRHISDPSSAGSAGPTTTTYTTTTPAATCSNLAIAPITSPTTSNPGPAINWCPFNSTKSSKIAYGRKHSTTEPTRATSSARAWSPSFSSGYSSKYGQFAHPLIWMTNKLP